MPLVSKAQQGWMFVHHPKMAKEWADKTPNIKGLPEHVKKSKVYKKAYSEERKRLARKKSG